MSGNNFAELANFRNRWRHIADPHMRELQHFVIEAAVTYSSSVLNGGATTEVDINCHAGPGDGKISIRPQGVLSIDYVHLDFAPSHQDFKYKKKSGALVVSGNSQKMRGSYTLTIQPIEDAENDNA